ncbi:MAG: hypothetical protein ACI9UV_001210 [Algoriphagus sp.]|jgi:hypothetical protein
MKEKSLVLLFVISLFFSCEQSNSSNNQNDFSSLIKVVKEIEAELSLLNDEIVLLKNYNENLIAKRDSILKNAKPNPYQFEVGFSTNVPGGDINLSSIVITEKTPSFQEALQEVKLTNSLDSVFKAIKGKYSFVAQVYSNSSMQVSRVFPAYDAKYLTTTDIDLVKYNFYYEANEENNPLKGPVWIPDAYVDPAGRGWILSLIHPIYDEDELFSVIGIDITVDEIIARYLSPEDENLIIVTKNGDIVAAGASAIEVLSFPPLKNYIYKDIILEDNFRISDYNLFNSKNEEVRVMADEFLLKKKSIFEFSEEYSPKSARMVYFDLIDWVLIEVNL